ncbi:lipase maturation factor family protein [Prauserella cavernicola]|uniref:Lipase maturation factor family protein n=1 Tax=Prauserella cavernicola TaxID=2800127 RepID=A0A934V6Y6_9PSEU|nr:lipase maturation factor family protein [Prauserella cavernicola]MBK1786163.1 lipase maturation factor family protein [Prauserella cavernicola]
MSWEWFGDQDYWASRLVFQRMLAAIYLVAFVVALNQFRALLGERGLLPIPRFVREVGFRRSPSLFHLHYSDRFFFAIALSGALVSAALVAGLADGLPVWAHMLFWTVPWVFYLSIVNVGQLWYSFGWESLLLEAGFLAIFLGPAHVEPPVLVLWLLLWLLFRVEFGAGLIKLRGDRCWRDLTCLYYHHETQPMPGPLSWYFHHLPRPLHTVEAGANHVAQLVVPFVLFAPQPAATVAAGIVIATQGWLVLSGNFSWLNVITITLAVSTVDGHLFPMSPPTPEESPLWYRAVVLALTAGVVVLSYWPIRNLLGHGQIMNYSFNRLHLVNAYGAFGTISRDRHEVIIEGTDDQVVSADTTWREYELKGKPGDPRRRPHQIAPYHLRLDWQLWFVSLSSRYGSRWLPELATRLLAGDELIVKLFRRNPFPDSPPTFVRARLFHYRYTTPRERRETGAWWVREPVGLVIRTCTLAADGKAVAAGSPD